MTRWLLLALPLFAAPTLQAADDDDPKAALQALNDYVGVWKGSGGPDRPGNPKPGESWSEAVSWSWKFAKDAPPALGFTVKDGKYFKAGEVRYLADQKLYELTATDAKGMKSVYTGELKKGYLTFERTDDKLNKTYQLRWNLAGDNVRMVYAYAEKPKKGTVYTRLFKVETTKEGESLGASAKAERECIVTGGLGTMQVSFLGKSYWVCCTGCRDAFNETPEKFVKAFEDKKKGK